MRLLFFLRVVFSSLSCDQNMTRNDYEQYGLVYYESKHESKDDDGAKKINVQPESEVKNVILELLMNYLVLFGMTSI